MTERHRRVTNSARVSCPAEVSSPADSTVAGETWTGAGVTPAGGGPFLNKAYAMARAGGHTAPTGEGPKTVHVDYDDDCSWQRLSGQALIEALDWVISEGNGFPDSSASHANWCSRAWQVADAARSHLSFDSQNGVMQDDLAAIMRAVGLSDAARQYSPHEAVQRDLLPRLAKIFDNTSLVARYQLDLQFHGPDNLEGIWRAYQSTRCTLAGDLLEGWGRTPGAAIENAVDAIRAASPNIDEPEGEMLEDLCHRLDKWRLYGCADAALEAAHAIRTLLTGRAKMRRRFEEMYECAQKYGGGLQRLGEMLRAKVAPASLDGLRAGDDVIAGLETVLRRLIEREPVAWQVTHEDGYQTVTWTPEGIANAKAAGCTMKPLFFGLEASDGQQ